MNSKNRCFVCDQQGRKGDLIDEDFLKRNCLFCGRVFCIHHSGNPIEFGGRIVERKFFKICFSDFSNRVNHGTVQSSKLCLGCVLKETQPKFLTINQFLEKRDFILGVSDPL